MCSEISFGFIVYQMRTERNCFSTFQMGLIISFLSYHKGDSSVANRRRFGNEESEPLLDSKSVNTIESVDRSMSQYGTQ